VGRAAVAVTVISLFVVVVAGLILIGLRQRPLLEVPARPWPEPIPMPPVYLRLWILGLAALLVGCTSFAVLSIAGFRTAGLVLVAVGFAVWLASLVVRLAMSIGIALRARKRQAGPPAR
jgi:hypothetical protein